MKNVFTSAKPFYVLAKILGLFALSFDGPASKGNLRTKWLDFFYSGVFFLLPAILIAMYSLFGDDLVDESALLAKAWVVQNIFGVALLIIPFAYQQSKRQSIKTFLNGLDAFDTKVK